jgi:peptidoglycan/LPS O-acetylase OafA/YrhL
VIKAANNFDILRHILAILVFVTHWNNLTQKGGMFTMGDYRTDTFFIISGFLIFLSFDSDHDKKRFYTKRFFRIFPLYAIVIAAQTLFFIIYSDGSTWQLIKYFLSNIFFLNFLSPSVGSTLSDLTRDAINGALWTLKNEVVFYLIVPVLYAFYKKWGLKFFIFLYILCGMYMFVSDFINIHKLLVLFPAQFRFILVGILLYVMFDKINKNNIYLLAAFGFNLILLFKSNYVFDFLFYPIMLGFIIIFVVYYLPVIRIKYDFSYSFFIFHYPIIQLTLYFGLNPSNPALSLIALFSVILILSLLSEKYIEKRFIQMGKDIIKRKYPR